MSQEELINDVVSIRQYRRYLNGESDIPFPVVDVLCERLGIQTITLIKEMEAARAEETKKIDELYNSVLNSINSESNRIISTLKDFEIIDPENRLLYRHSVLLLDYSLAKVSKESYVEKNKELLGFPKFKKKTIFTMVEILILSNILDFFESIKEPNEIYEKILAQLNSEATFLNDQFSQTINIALFRLAKYSGMKKKFEDVITFCNIGINRNIKSSSYYLMDYFYYFLSLSYFHLEKFDEFESALIKCYHILNFEGNLLKIDLFSKWISKDFDVNLNEFAIKFNQKNIQK
jgi:transcriptional regulator with XRE-family HTH domain